MRSYRYHPLTDAVAPHPRVRTLGLRATAPGGIHMRHAIVVHTPAKTLLRWSPHLIHSSPHPSQMMTHQSTRLRCLHNEVLSDTSATESSKSNLWEAGSAINENRPSVKNVERREEQMSDMSRQLEIAHTWCVRACVRVPHSPLEHQLELAFCSCC